MKKYIFKIQQLIILLFWCICSTSCQNSAKTELLGFGYEFFPLEIGGYIIYEVNKIVYTSSGDVFKSNYQLKEVITDTFTNATRQKVYVLERYLRNNETQEWAIDSVWSAYRTNIQAVRQENNISFVRLSFPLKENLEWNGNFFNTNSREDYKVINLNKSLTINKLNFEKTLKVRQAYGDGNLVSLKAREEIYAENVGIISIADTLVSYKQSNNISNYIISDGRIINQNIIAYGKN